MKRALVFLVLAPVAVFLTVLLICLAMVGTKFFGFAWFGATALSILTLPMSATAAAVDGFLARTCPISLRVYLSVIVGAAIATGEAAVFSSLLPSSLVMALTIGGASVMGACSLLSHDYSGRQDTTREPDKSRKSGWFHLAGTRFSLS
ncbi:hypothetical protein [Bradyrhizobium roseum]|uniref:hypothetical protein n=1 Tax=Bradyrhizobium roseum TaxID=3056648 RepID=UPI00262414C1|nr:hypothetical protein [Bradyrhizobium roseus]WKA27866.1 hypothetical protein QUH67_30595 [Bradyrhizobium roseus]